MSEDIQLNNGLEPQSEGLGQYVDLEAPFSVEIKDKCCCAKVYDYFCDFMSKWKKRN